MKGKEGGCGLKMVSREGLSGDIPVMEEKGTGVQIPNPQNSAWWGVSAGTETYQFVASTKSVAGSNSEEVLQRWFQLRGLSAGRMDQIVEKVSSKIKWNCR